MDLSLFITLGISSKSFTDSIYECSTKGCDSYKLFWSVLTGISTFVTILPYLFYFYRFYKEPKQNFYKILNNTFNKFDPNYILDNFKKSKSYQHDYFHNNAIFFQKKQIINKRLISGQDCFLNNFIDSNKKIFCGQNGNCGVENIKDIEELYYNKNKSYKLKDFYMNNMNKLSGNMDKKDIFNFMERYNYEDIFDLELKNTIQKQNISWSKKVRMIDKNKKEQEIESLNMGNGDEHTTIEIKKFCYVCDYLLKDNTIKKINFQEHFFIDLARHGFLYFRMNKDDYNKKYKTECSKDFNKMYNDVFKNSNRPLINDNSFLELKVTNRKFRRIDYNLYKYNNSSHNHRKIEDLNKIENLMEDFKNNHIFKSSPRNETIDVCLIYKSHYNKITITSKNNNIYIDTNPKQKHCFDRFDENSDFFENETKIKNIMTNFQENYENTKYLSPFFIKNNLKNTGHVLNLFEINFLMNDILFFEYSNFEDTVVWDLAINCPNVNISFSKLTSCLIEIRRDLMVRKNDTKWIMFRDEKTVKSNIIEFYKKYSIEKFNVLYSFINKIDIGIMDLTFKPKKFPSNNL